MSPRRTLAMLFVTGILAAGCGAGLHSETDKEHATPYIAHASLGSMSVGAVRVILVSSSAGTTTTTGAPQAYLSATLVNSGDSTDTLTSATVGGGPVAGPGGASVSVDVPAQQVVLLGEPDLGLTGPALTVGALQTPLVIGTTTDVTFTFQTAGTTTVQAPVVAVDSAGTTASAYPVSASG